eukprot:CAMPEP_0175141244 /NCGR_PEP_ID=MMETSP0087-20121206/11998_1 /TAXON_ID=136419 /ORGANISM="Unknown Unknown, Strain D1" /LENGTH=228 /DNA_ID=CAMNT_0016424639 /DNA_START=59 /DNA_END=745 /DNA_ORIENTATION=-
MGSAQPVSKSSLEFAAEVPLAFLRQHHQLEPVEVRRLGLSSQDLLDLGVTNVKDRLAVLRFVRQLPPASVLPVQTPWPQHQDFTFVVSHFNSTRQWGKCLNIIVRYRYTPGSHVNGSAGYFDYRELRNLALQFAEPSPDIPMPTQWEVVNLAFVHEALTKYSDKVVAISSQIMVRHEMNPEIQEPGNHGSTVTVSFDNTTDNPPFNPVDEPWINAFSYDCTLPHPVPK